MTFHSGRKKKAPSSHSIAAAVCTVICVIFLSVLAREGSALPVSTHSVSRGFWDAYASFAASLFGY